MSVHSYRSHPLPRAAAGGMGVPPAPQLFLSGFPARPLDDRVDLSVDRPQNGREPRCERPALPPYIVMLTLLVSVKVEDLLRELLRFLLMLRVRLRCDVPVELISLLGPLAIA